MVVTPNGTKIEEGTLLRDVKLWQSDRNPDDGIAWIDKFAVIVKDAKVSPGATLFVDLRIENVRDKFAFATIV